MRATCLHHFLFLLILPIFHFCQCAYIINMYCIPLLLVTGKHTVKSVYIFSVSVFSSSIAANTNYCFPLVWENMFPFPVLIDPFLLISYFFLFDSNVPKQLPLILAGVHKLIMRWGLSMLQSFHYLQIWFKLILQVWNMLHFKNLLTLLGFSYRKHCLLGYFCCCPLVRIYSQLIVVDTTIYSGGLPNLVVLYLFLHHSDIFYPKCENTPRIT